MNNIRKAEGIHIVRSLILLIVITLVTLSTGLAQNKPQAKKGSQLDRVMNVYVKRLQLNKEQVEKFRPVMEQHLAKQKELKVKYKSNRTMMRKEMMAERTGMEQKLGEIATAEQMEKYQKWQNSYKTKKSNKKAIKKAPEAKTAPKPVD